MRTASAARVLDRRVPSARGREEGSRSQAPGGAFAAVVTAVEDPRAVVVSWAAGQAEGPTRARATLAVAGGYTPAVRDTVVVVGDPEAGELFVLGVVDAPRAARAPRALATRDGVRAEIVSERIVSERIVSERVVSEGAPGEAERELLRVHDAAGRLLFEHDAAAGRTTVCTPRGDLELRADAGAIRLVAASAVELRGAHGVDIQGGDSIRVAVASEGHEPASSLRLDAGGIAVAAPHVEAAARSADLAVGEGRLFADRLESTVGTLLQVVGAMETRATRIVARAREMFTDVEGTAQTRAERIRVVAADTFHLLGKRTLLRAEKDMKLKGEKIYLA